MEPLRYPLPVEKAVVPGGGPPIEKRHLGFMGHKFERCRIFQDRAVPRVEPCLPDVDLQEFIPAWFMGADQARREGMDEIPAPVVQFVSFRHCPFGHPVPALPDK